MTERTFTQEEVDRFVSDRLERQEAAFWKKQKEEPPFDESDPEMVAARDRLAAANESLTQAQQGERAALVRLGAVNAGVQDESRIARLAALVPADASDPQAAAGQVAAEFPELRSPAPAAAESDVARRIRERAGRM